MHLINLSEKNLIIGIGNPLRGDDAVGLHIVRRLQKHYGPALNCMEIHAPDILMAETFSRMEYILIIDAMRMEKQIPFQVSLIDPAKEIAPSPGFVTHVVGWQTILGMAGEFYGHTPKMELLAVGAEDFSFSETLSQPCAENADKAFKFLTSG